MVVAFGWGAGDIANAIKVVYKVSKAFKDAGGAKDQYSEATAFLDAFALTLTRLNEYTSTNPNTKFRDDIVQQVKLISDHYSKFEEYLKKYDLLLSSTNSGASAKVVGKKVKWAIDEMRDKVDELKKAVSEARLLVDTLLWLQILDDLSVVAQTIAGLSTSSQSIDILNALSRTQSVLDNLKHDIKALKAAADAQQTRLQDVKTDLSQQVVAESESVKQDQAAQASRMVDAVQQSESALQINLGMIDQQLRQLHSGDIKAQLAEQVLAITTIRDAILKSLQDVQKALPKMSINDSAPQFQQLTSSTWTQFVGNIGGIVGAVFGAVNFISLRTMSNNIGNENATERPASQNRPAFLPMADPSQLSCQDIDYEEQWKLSSEKVMKARSTRVSPTNAQWQLQSSNLVPTTASKDTPSEAGTPKDSDKVRNTDSLNSHSSTSKSQQCSTTTEREDETSYLRKFKNNQNVWVTQFNTHNTLLGTIKNARLYCNGWLYLVRIEKTGEDKWVPEAELRVASPPQ